MVEHHAVNVVVRGSSPLGGASEMEYNKKYRAEPWLYDIVYGNGKLILSMGLGETVEETKH